MIIVREPQYGMDGTKSLYEFHLNIDGTLIPIRLPYSHTIRWNDFVNCCVNGGDIHTSWISVSGPVSISISNDLFTLVYENENIYTEVKNTIISCCKASNMIDVFEKFVEYSKYN